MSKHTFFALFAGKTITDSAIWEQCNERGMPEVDAFRSGSTGLRARRDLADGAPDRYRFSSFVIVASDLVEPLMNPMVLPEDRALDTFRLAETILHETALFGGIMAPVVNYLYLPGVSCGGIIQHNWPTYRYESYTEDMPVLDKNKPKDWDKLIYYPVPVSYFMSLQSREFWDVYVRKFGSTATHMGPKIVGLCIFKPDKGAHRFQKWSVLRDIIPIPDDSPGFFSSKKTKIAHSFDVEKRRMAEIITKASRSVNPEPKLPIWDTGEKGFAINIPDEKAAPVQLDCPRYDEIRRYLEENKFALAIHTMDFNMPAHLFRGYIERHGGINLTNAEWKTFLLVANTRNELFDHAGRGMIKVNPVGWQQPPQATYPPKPRRPDKRLAEIFEFLCQRTLKDIDLEQRTKDFDMETTKHEVNAAWKRAARNRRYASFVNYPQMPHGFPYGSAGDALLYECIYYSDYFVDAPHGQRVARRKGNVTARSIQVPTQGKSVHETIAQADPMRLGPQDLGIPVPLLPPPRPVQGGFGAGSHHVPGAASQPTPTHQPHRPPKAEGSQPPSPTFEERFGSLGWGNPPQGGATSTYQPRRPVARPKPTYRPYGPP
ncbi:hypothetical protein NHQ30_000927 [Ciborinia camelliae]|nr:hypothetical protein NHQ30_000927 [Ciborinia camelliae]